jgi:hypothetical protein
MCPPSQHADPATQLVARARILEQSSLRRWLSGGWRIARQEQSHQRGDGHEAADDEKRHRVILGIGLTAGPGHARLERDADAEDAQADADADLGQPPVLATCDGHGERDGERENPEHARRA